MKIRFNYVSNSSSSSFIIDEFNFIKFNINGLKLTDELKSFIMEHNLDSDSKSIVLGDGNYYLTEYISDCCDDYYNLRNAGICYSDGDSCGPYDIEENFRIFVGGCDFYLCPSYKNDGFPDSVVLTKKARNILNSNLDDKLKLKTLKEIFCEEEN